ncbi:MAG: cobalamin-binding protein [Clostridia bacterium]|nr:cobalamin-binding protein [Clostridia bacterium]
MVNFAKIYNAVMEGDDDIAQEEAQALAQQGVPAMDIINHGLISAMGEIGVLFKAGELFVPEVMMSAQTIAGVIEMLKPQMATEMDSRGTIIIGTVKGDLHDIGKNLVALLLSSNGYTVHDLGSDVDAAEFVRAALEHDADIVALSALLTTTLDNMEQTIAAFSAQGLREQVKIIVGGAPVTAEFAAEINADGYSEDALGAVDLVNKLMEG